MALYKSTAKGNTHMEKWNEKVPFNKIPIACHTTQEFELYQVEEKEKIEETAFMKRAFVDILISVERWLHPKVYQLVNDWQKEKTRMLISIMLRNI